MIIIDKEFQSLIPPLSSEEKQGLEKLIIKDGCTDTIKLWNNTIIDGHNRYEICTRLGIEFKTESMQFDSRESVKLWMIELQGGRRNINDAWKFKLEMTYKEIEAKIGKEKYIETVGRPSSQIADKSLSIIDNDKTTPQEKHNTQKKLADRLNWSTGKTAMTDKVFKEAAPEVLEKVLSGEKSINAVYQEIKKENAAKEKREKYEQKLEQAKEKPITERPASFDVILADPPWRYEFAETDNRKIENHYDTATLEEIISHKPQSSENSVLLLWTTAPKLIEGIEVLKGWGFEYKSHAIWDKVKIGMGYWFRGQHEILLVGTKGKFSPPDSFNRTSSIFTESRNTHSSKPNCVYEWIERCYPLENKLEMYCRKPRENWFAWGNEV